MKKFFLLEIFNPMRLIFILWLSATVFSCQQKDVEPELVGQPGNPRFNLQFSTEDVDFDLYVQTPSGKIISFRNRFADKGTLDVDCLCGGCPQGPNENIFWVAGTAPTGTYKYWVEFYKSCNDQSAEYTVRVVRDSRVIETQTGTLTSSMRTTPKWTHIQQ